MDTFLWWSGAVAWVALGVTGILCLSGVAIEWTVDTLWCRKEFIAFVADRLRKHKSN